MHTDSKVETILNTFKGREKLSLGFISTEEKRAFIINHIKYLEQNQPVQVLFVGKRKKLILTPLTIYQS